MKLTFHLCCMVLASSAILLPVSCKKDELPIAETIELSPSATVQSKASNCDIESLLRTYEEYYFEPPIYLFRKEYDQNGVVVKILTSLFAAGIPHDSITLDLHYDNKKIVFTKEGDANAEVFTAHFSEKGRVSKLTVGNSVVSGFSPTAFVYEDNRLSEIQVEYGGKLVVSYLEYDAYDNLIKVDETGTADDFDLAYYYDLTRKAREQFYFDESRSSIQNGYHVAMFMGWFPELNPRHMRIRTEMSGVLGGGYHILENHVIEKNRLQSYSYGGATLTSKYRCGSARKD